MEGPQPLPLNKFPQTFFVNDFSGGNGTSSLLYDQNSFFDQFSSVNKISLILNSLLKRGSNYVKSYQMLNGLIYLYFSNLNKNMELFFVFINKFLFTFYKIVLLYPHFNDNFYLLLKDYLYLFAIKTKNNFLFEFINFKFLSGESKVL
tara:strand:+ start:243 stop:686 length:444 start_codon:yes stop_codon:yes gene_type:complete